MDSGKQFGIGLRLCWGSLALVPLGLLAIGGGPCAGPRNAMGSAILLLGGLGSVGLAVYGIFRVLRGIRAASSLMRVWGALSVCCAGFAGFVGGIYVLLGFVSLDSFLRY